MANQVFNIALGRVVELYGKVKNGTPGTSRLVIMVLASEGPYEGDSVMKDKDTFADIVAGTTNEVTNTNYAKKVLASADLTSFTWAPTDASDVWDLDIPDQTWTAINTGNTWHRLVIGYDDAGTQVLANIVPMTMHDFVVVPDNSDITAQIAATGFFRAS